MLNNDQRAALAQAIERGPIPYLDGAVLWRLFDLAQWLWEEFRVSVSEQTLAAKCAQWATADSQLARGI
ncbi:hypothetical protein GOB19_00190 [Sinorhizobium meliloti]|uniref:hypothetical protein n=1 Tax=Rhizobium meliloti TaxID=382 RepID=UPI000FD9FE65|nr:hypothetical protein [Sinorhizobium meliloti]MDX0011484.1 hypothetical protein [Sinorhizobium meliloti]MDX0303459.1 hypothetical protein [Sinorhizobium meliloti]RVG77894.1 hypothetical protein CN223_13955 [Sinorhizobium meliloti]RVK26162.1 hypothetical protein CN163_32340 [Sinorhizobium meliloti]